MKILITGGTGFIGTQVCKKLLHQGHEVVLLTRIKSKPQPGLRLPGVSFFEYPYTADSVIPADLMQTIDGMAGEPIFTGRWNEEKRNALILFI